MILTIIFFRNSSSSDDEPRHPPSPPGPNPHRVKRSALSAFSFFIYFFFLRSALSSFSFLFFYFTGLSLVRLIMRKTYALLERNWRKQRTRQLTNGKFLKWCECQLKSNLIKSFAGTLTLTTGLRWRVGIAGRRRPLVTCPCLTSRYSESEYPEFLIFFSWDIKRQQYPSIKSPN